MVIVKTVDYKEDNLCRCDFLIFCMLFSLFVSSQFYVAISINFTSIESLYSIMCILTQANAWELVAHLTHFMVNAGVCALD